MNFPPLHSLRQMTGMAVALLLSLGLIHSARAQEETKSYLNRFWQTSEGLPSNTVNDLAKDPDGFLWIATGAGVAKFDGIRFEVFTPEDGLPDTQIFCLHIDRQGRVWVGTRRGAAYRENGVWHAAPDFPQTIVFSLGESHDGAIWAGTASGPWRWLDGKASRIDLGKANPDTRSFLSEGEHGMWILTQGNLCLWHPGNPGQIEEISGPWADKDLRDLVRDNEGRLIVCGTGLLVRREGNEWKNLADKIPSGAASAFLSCTIAPDDTLWLATRERGIVFMNDDQSGTVDTSAGLSLNDVRCVFLDAEQTLWAGTNGGGVNNLRRRSFDTYSNHEGLGRTVTSALVVDREGQVLAGTDGAGILKKQEGMFVPIRQEGLPADGLIWSLAAHSDGSLWVGTHHDGLFRIHNGRAEKILLTSDSSLHAIAALHETRDGGVLIGTHKGVCKWLDGRIDPKVPPLPENSDYVIYDILEDRRGRIWAATGNLGIWRFDNGQWSEMSRALGRPDLIPVTLHESADGALWVGTLGQGVARFLNGTWSSWHRTDGIASDTICQILEDDAGNLWLGSDCGLQRVSTKELADYTPANRRHTLKSIRFSREDGLPTQQFSGEHGNLAVRAPDGCLWFSLASGVIRVDPQGISWPKNVPSVRIESASMNSGRIWNFETARPGEAIIVDPSSGTLQIRFTSPDFLTPTHTRFLYRMTGLEKEWQEVEGTRAVSYTPMPPGNYHFEVLRANADGAWNPLSASVDVVVKPSFWQTLQFRIISSILGLAGLGFLIRTWSLRRLRRQLFLVQQERRIEKERARIARDLHDELGATLSEVNFLGTLTANTIADSSARSRVESIVERAQRMAKSLDEIVWTVNPANDFLSFTANYLCSRSEQSLGAAAIRSRLDVSENLPTITVNSELRHHLLMTVNEAVHNVMKHSGASECTLSIHMNNGSLQVSVADNGTGFDPTNTPDNRNGLKNIQRRMEATGGSVHIESGTQGTVVTLRIPLP